MEFSKEGSRVANVGNDSQDLNSRETNRGSVEYEDIESEYGGLHIDKGEGNRDGFGAKYTSTEGGTEIVS